MKSALARSLAIGLATAAGCGGGSDKKAAATPDIEIPERPATPGDAMLALAPAGADAVLEVDLARLRANPVVGDLVGALSASAPSGETAAGRLDLFAGADEVLLATYDLGGQPERLMLLSGPGVSDLPDAVPLSDGAVALASEPMRARLAAVQAGTEPALASDRELLQVRALAMPERAPGASLRVTARLDFDARVAVARDLGLDEVPVSVSIWGDVVDDLAVVALVGGDGKADGAKLARDLKKVTGRLAGSLPLRAVGLGPVLKSAKIEAKGTSARLVLLIGPHRLARIAARLERHLGVAKPKEQP